MEKNDKLYQLTPLTDKDRFFKTSVDQCTAGWQRKWLENFGGYADKYTGAFDQLADVVRDNTYNKDQLTYPIMFLARHILELRLKELNHLCIQLKFLKETKPTHSLLTLWKSFDEVYHGEKNEHYFKVGKLITELHNVDSKSDTFRYPIHKDGTPTATSEFVDIENFIDVFSKLDVFLEGVEMELHQLIDDMS
jgi:hypothetical protein